MKTIDVKGKPYVTVNERLKEFRNTFKDYSLVTEIIELGVDFCTMKAVIIDDKGIVRATGFAREVIAKSPINKFAFVENCETSAMGRALGNFGIGIDEAVCTADELLMKLSQDQKSEKAEFEKEAKAEKAQHTKSLNKAVKEQDESLIKQEEDDEPLDVKYKKAMKYLNACTPNDYKNLNKSSIDKLNRIEVALREAGCQQWLEDICKIRNELADIETGNIY